MLIHSRGKHNFFQSFPTRPCCETRAFKVKKKKGCVLTRKTPHNNGCPCDKNFLITTDRTKTPRHRQKKSKKIEKFNQKTQSEKMRKQSVELVACRRRRRFFPFFNGGASRPLPCVAFLLRPLFRCRGQQVVMVQWRALESLP